MAEYSITEVSAGDRYTMEQVVRLLEAEGIRKDRNLDYTCAMLDEDDNVIATGSCIGNTLRCMAVDHRHQGEALMNDIVTHLVDYQFQRGNYHLFLYTKCSSAKFFGSLGFHEIARVEGQIVFMENRRNGFAEYLDRLRKETDAALREMQGRPVMSATGTDGIQQAATAGQGGNRPEHAGAAGKGQQGEGVSALVMNANPFTLGHRYLADLAAGQSSLLHLFIVSEDRSLVPFPVRKRLVMEGTAGHGNIIYHDSGSYIISSATFPAYFQKDDTAVIESQARLDLAIFRRIAEALGIMARYVGSEPTSVVTGLYNEIMAQELPEAGIRCEIIPRKEEGGAAISASTVRQALKDGDMERLRRLVPETTLRYFESPEAEPVIRRICAEEDVKHY